jgi:hypothetical protein
LHYIHRFRFTGVSNQMQPQEMFAQLRNVMRLGEIFDDLKDELTTATNFLSLRSAQRGATSTERIGVVATFATVMGVATGLLTLPYFFTPERLTEMITATDKALWLTARRELAIVALAVGTIALLSMLVSSLVPGGSRKETSPVVRFIKRFLGFGGGFLVLLAAFLFFWPYSLRFS